MTNLTADHYIRVFDQCMDKPMRLPAFVSIAPDLPNHIWWPLFRHVWQSTESAFLHVPELRKTVNAIRTSAPERYAFMTEEETKAFKSHKRRKKPVRIYRGAVEANMAGLSWTLNKDKAAWFATRWGNETPQVITAEIAPDMIVQWMFERGAREVICFPEDAEVLKVNKLIPKPRTQADLLELHVQVYGQDAMLPEGEYTKFKMFMNAAPEDKAEATRASITNELSEQVLLCEGIGLFERANEIKELIVKVQDWKHGEKQNTQPA